MDVIYLEVVYQTGSFGRKAVRFDNIVAPVQKLGSVDLRFAVSSSLKAVCIIIEALMTYLRYLAIDLVQDFDKFSPVSVTVAEVCSQLKIMFKIHKLATKLRRVELDNWKTSKE